MEHKTRKTAKGNKKAKQNTNGPKNSEVFKLTSYQRKAE